MSAAIVLIVKAIACLFGLAIWSTIGIVIWIAKIIRVVAAFCAKAALQAFNPQDMAPSERSIQTALAFWPDGVKRILKIFDSSAPDASEATVTWDKILPGLLQDTLYAAIIVSISLGFVFVTEKTSDALLLQFQPKWVSALNSNEVVAGRGAAGVVIGSALTNVEQTLGRPSFIEHTSGSNKIWHIYATGSTQLGIRSTDGSTVDRLLIFDRDYGSGSSLPPLLKAALGSSEENLVAQMGKPLERRSISYKPCDKRVGDASAIHLMYSGIQFTLCAKNNKTILVELVK